MVMEESGEKNEKKAHGGKSKMKSKRRIQTLDEIARTESTNFGSSKQETCYYWRDGF